MIIENERKSNIRLSKKLSVLFNNSWYYKCDISLFPKNLGFKNDSVEHLSQIVYAGDISYNDTKNLLGSSKLHLYFL